MDANEFREIGQKTIDWIANYKEGIRDLPVISQEAPGYLADVLPSN